MIDQLLVVLRDVFLVVGAAAVLTGSIGVLRLPDFFTRIHATGITDTAGIGLILAGLMIEGGYTLISQKLVFIVLLVLITSPTSSHALAKAAIHAGYSPMTEDTGEPSSN